MENILETILKGESETVEFNGYGFDYQIQSDATMNDIEIDALYKFLDIANSVRNINENVFLPPDIILQKLELMKDDKITKAALLLFGKNPQHFFSGHYEIKCGNFIDDNDYNKMINDQVYNQNIINNFYSVLNFVLGSIRKSSEKGEIHDTEVWEFPIGVIREVLVNMIVHRDYRQGMKSTVEIRPSKVLFYNPAQLFEPTINIQRLRKHHPSRPGDKLIAKIFYLMGLFENWGSGTLRIISDTIKYGKAMPEFYFEDGMFKLELYRREMDY